MLKFNMGTVRSRSTLFDMNRVTMLINVIQHGINHKADKEFYSHEKVYNAYQGLVQDGCLTTHPHHSAWIGHKAYRHYSRYSL